MAWVHCVVVVVVSCCTDLLLHPSRLLSWMSSAKCPPLTPITNRDHAMLNAVIHA
jgi:hypothetical protein